MPKWLDELEAQPDESPLRKYLLPTLVVVVVLAMVWRFGLQSEPTPIPPPSGDVYRNAVPEVAKTSYEGRILEVTVDKRWNRLERGLRTDRIIALMDSTGSFDYDRIRIRDTDGDVVALVDADGSITWVEGPP
jgi:hypothetical protein